MSTTEPIFRRFIEIVAALRHPQTGCPWDLEQTHLSLRPYLIEEAYELLEAIESGDDKEFALELGDLLLQVVLHAQLAKERGAFDIDGVIQGVSEKMIRRHPHVFGNTKAETSSDVLKNWEQIKLAEGKSPKYAGVSPLLEGVPKNLPALIRAQRLGEKASKANFDWRSAAEVWKKVQEELGELEAELEPLPRKEPMLDVEQKRRITHELGDVLFALCQTARFVGINAEDALREGCDRFTNRFSVMEKLASGALTTLGDDELEALWQQAKKALVGATPPLPHSPHPPKEKE